jgi:hypothetical protein
MISTIAHELVEAITDPAPFTAWVDAYGEENADICGMDFGNYCTSSTGGFDYNVVVGGRKFFIQTNRDPILVKCE